MWFAFIDESGTPEFNKDELNSTPFYIVTAVIINERGFHDLEESIIGLKRKYLPKTHWNIEIHTSEIIHGNKKYRGVKEEARVNFLTKLFDFIRDFEDLTIISVIMKKKDILESHGYLPGNAPIGLINRLKPAARERAYYLLAERLALFLTKKIREGRKECMLLVIDDSTKKHNRGIMNDLETALKEGIYARSMLGSSYIILPPLFASSHRYIGIQLADAIDYVILQKWKGNHVKRAFNFDYYMQTVYRKLDKDKNGNFWGYGIKEWYGRLFQEKR